MTSYLMKYKGKYRLKAHICQNTNDFPRDENGNLDTDDVYIKCANNCQIYHYGKSTLVAYIPSLGRGHNILFAMANPVPEIMPDVAKAAGARVVGTGRSDFPNQVNNVIAFPGIFKGALEGRATQITEEMKLAAAEALAHLVSDEELNDEFIMPEAFDPRVAEVVSQAVKSHIVK